METGGFTIAGESNIGLGRSKNEDNYSILSPPGFPASLAVVSDGIGGHRHGEVASMYCCIRLMRAFLRHGRGLRSGEEAARFLHGELDAINRRLFYVNELDERERPIGCTAICAVFTDTELAFCGAGDSRFYEYDTATGKLRRLSTDHVVPDGTALSRAIGIRRRVELSPEVLPLRPECIYLLCSDGLHHFVGDGEIADVLRESTNPRMAVGKLMRRTLLHGGSDNITIVAAGFVPHRRDDVPAGVCHPAAENSGPDGGIRTPQTANGTEL